MATILDALKGLNAYPVPQRTLEAVAAKRSVDLSAEATADVQFSKEFMLAKADILRWTSLAPNVSQGGQSYTFPDAYRKTLQAEANAIYAAFGESTETTGVVYGYKGSRL